MTARKPFLRLPYDGTPPILQPFGGHPEVYRRFGMLGHPGTDVGLYQAPVLAAHDGVVEYAGEGAEWPMMGSAAGLSIILKADGFATDYAHLSRTYVGIGDVVKAGDVIAISGNTGATTGYHLHWSVIFSPRDMKNGYYGRSDPMPYVIEATS